MNTRPRHALPALAICATFIACAALLSRAGDPAPPEGPARSTMHTLEDIYQAVSEPTRQTVLGANEFILLRNEPAADPSGDPTWIDVVEGDGVLVRVLGTPTGTNGRQLLRDGTGRALGEYSSFPYDTELGVPFENGIQAMPGPGFTTINLMLVYRRTPTAAAGE